MARLLTTGFEVGDLRMEPGFGDAPGQVTAPVLQAGTPTISTTTVRTGSRALRIQGGQNFRFGGFGTTSDVPRYVRAYVYFAAFPASGAQGVMNHTAGYEVRIQSTGVLELAFGGTLIGSGVQLSTGVWYRIEYMSRMNSTGGSDDSGELRVDGTTIASETNVARGTTVSGNMDIGDGGADASYDAFFDDVAINNNVGSDENSFPGEGRVYLLKPESDNSVGTGWEAPQTSGADTTAIFNAVDNIPPVGVAHSDVDANNNAYIFHAAANQNNYDVNMQSYTTAGVLGTIKTVQGFVRTGSSSTTNRAGALDIVSNPDQGSETAFTTFDAANVTAGTEPTGWATTKGAVVYAPSVTPGTSPVFRVGKRVSNAQVCMVDFMGIYVEAVEVVPPSDDVIMAPIAGFR